MTPQLKAAIMVIQSLSETERQQLLQILTQNNIQRDSDLAPQADLKTLSTQFQQGISIQQLRTAQNPVIVHNPEDLAADFWPAEESIGDFLAFLRQQRQEVS
ncbi:MAG: hypothetical protein WBD47_01750 [Phormidesmis sp.]